MNTTRRTFHVLAGAALLLGGCAGTNVNQQRMVDAQATVAAVEELEVEDPEVSLHLEYARDQLAAARRLIDDGDEEEANRMLERAHADAELALAMARTERSRKQAREAWAEVEELREQ